MDICHFGCEALPLYTMRLSPVSELLLCSSANGAERSHGAPLNCFLGEIRLDRKVMGGLLVAQQRPLSSITQAKQGTSNCVRDIPLLRPILLPRWLRLRVRSLPSWQRRKRFRHFRHFVPDPAHVEVPFLIGSFTPSANCCSSLPLTLSAARSAPSLLSRRRLASPGSP